MSYPDVSIFIGGWRKAEGGATLPVVNPASGEIIGELPRASSDDLARAVAVAEAGFSKWRTVPALERENVLKKAAAILAGRAEVIAPTLTQEQGKPLAEARSEVAASIDLINWFGEECR